MKTKREEILCHFVGEITARAFVKDQERDAEAEFEHLMEAVTCAQGVILRAVPHLVVCYVWPRFG